MSKIDLRIPKVDPFCIDPRSEKYVFYDNHQNRVFWQISYELFFFTNHEEKVGILKKSLYDPIIETISYIYISNLIKTRAQSSILKKSVVRTLKLFTRQIILVKTGKVSNVHIWSKDTISGPLLNRPPDSEKVFFVQIMKIAIFDEISYELFFFSFDEEKVVFLKKDLWTPILLK